MGGKEIEATRDPGFSINEALEGFGQELTGMAAEPHPPELKRPGYDLVLDIDVPEVVVSTRLIMNPSCEITSFNRAARMNLYLLERELT